MSTTSFHHTPRSRQPAPPLRHRSSSGVRSGTNSYGSSRPRSVGYYGSNTNPYSSSSSYSSPYSNGSSYSSALNSYNPSYGSSYQSPYFQNGYRGGAGGYAGLTIPAKALSNVNVLAQNYPKSYDNSYLKNDNGRRSRRDLARGSSYRERSLSRSMGSLPGNGMGPRSTSLTSLNSEGYFSGSERSSRSRISSLADIRNENGEIDYKKLYEDQLVENERLKDKLRKSDEELRETKQTLERLNVVTSKNSLSELEKRERRAMERKLSEMEEELKQLQKLKAENERLKADNRSLTRVINKLTNSARP